MSTDDVGHAPFIVTSPCPVCGGQAGDGHPPEQIRAMKEGLERLERQGVEPLDD